MGLTIVRSVLFFPAHNSRAVEKAVAGDLLADLFVMDLEDATPASEKDNARNYMTSALPNMRKAGLRVAVRINGVDTDEYNADLDAALSVSPDVLILPMVDSRGEIDAVASKTHAADIPVWAMIETAKGVMNAFDIAQVPGVTALVAGGNDLRKSLNTKPLSGRLDIQYQLQHVVTAAKAAGILAIDAVYNDFSNADGLMRDCVQGRSFGFDGKSLIHPSQISAANEAFSPTEEEYEAAKALVASYGDMEGGAKRHDGEMVEALHIEAAKDLIALFEKLQNQ